VNDQFKGLFAWEDYIAALEAASPKNETLSGLSFGSCVQPRSRRSFWAGRFKL